MNTLPHAGRVVAIAIGLALGSSAMPRAEETSPGVEPAIEAPAPAVSRDSEALKAPKPKPVPARDPKAIADAIDRGVAYLLKDQNKDGSWGSAERTKGLNIYAPAPGAHQAFRAAVTALCTSALLEVGSESPEVSAAIDRGEEYLLTNLPKVRRATPDAMYNVWTHAYGIQALVRLHKRKPDDEARRKRIVEVIESQIELLARYESVDGGWGYYDFRYRTKQPSSDSISFTTATGLIALHEARQIGVNVPERLGARAVAAVGRQRKPDFSYLYGEYLKWEPMHPVNRPGGSLGRTQVCNVALRLWGEEKITDAVMAAWLDRLFARNLWLDIGRKRPIPHESHFAVAGYFFYYGHYYAAVAIEMLPPDDRSQHFDQLAYRILALQEKDGTWWDYPLYNYHQQYGTAFALMTLGKCR